jgi:hypothetical protein
VNDEPVFAAVRETLRGRWADGREVRVSENVGLGSLKLQGGLMYDAAHLYVAARVGDPEPMRNAARDGFQFAGGSVIVRLAADRRLGWPLRGTGRPFRPPNASPELLVDSVNERVTSLILWFDATSGQAKLDLQHSFELQRPATVPAGWQGAFQKGRGRTRLHARVRDSVAAVPL